MITAEWWIGEEAADSQDSADEKVRASWLFRDLVAVSGEFQELAIDLAKRTITVHTDSIELEDVFLGRFAMRLRWSPDRQQRPSYHVLPLDDTASRSMSEVCHPHVSNHNLCEGDASGPIRQALLDGRLHDFFLVVSRVLETYNPESPYVRLSDWDSSACDGCGDLVADADVCSCQTCGESYCSGCIESCSGCYASSCSSCLETCHQCDCKFCESCFAECRECGGSFCNDCLVEEICNDCENKRLAEVDDDEALPDPENSETAETEAEV